MIVLLNSLCILAAAGAGGVEYRCRGGFIGLGRNMTNPARLLWWVVPTAGLIAALYHVRSGHFSIGLMLLCAGAVWLGLLGLKRFDDLPGGHGWCQGRGKLNYLGMAVIGLYRHALLGLALLFWMPDLAAVLPFAGLLQGAAYAIGWELLHGRELIRWHPANPNADDGSGFDHFAKSGSEWGEVLTGAFCWGAIVALALPWG